MAADRQTARRLWLFAALAAFLVLAPMAARATVDVCAVNTITQEGYVFDEEDYMGIGWHPLNERDCDAFDDFLAQRRYEKTGWPHKLELLILLAAAIPLIALIAARSR